MNWNGKELDTYGELSDAILAIARADDQDAADRFMAAYRLDNPVGADQNVGYLSGYCSPDTMAKVQRMFKVAHPIFGIRTDVGAEEAFDTGYVLGLASIPDDTL